MAPPRHDDIKALKINGRCPPPVFYSALPTFPAKFDVGGGSLDLATQPWGGVHLDTWYVSRWIAGALHKKIENMNSDLHSTYSQ
jgi:hypothetical protein